jgi:hypothetical protein
MNFIKQIDSASYDAIVKAGWVKTATGQ